MTDKLAKIAATVRKVKKQRDTFYASWEWKQIRYEALRKYGRKCGCCGWSPEHGGGGWIVVDHVKPRKKYPELELDIRNMQVLCNYCNMGKGRRFEDDYRK